MRKVLFLFCLLSVSIVASLTQKEIAGAYYKSYNYEKMGNYSDAIKSLALVESTFPKGYTVQYRLGYLFFLQQKYANALRHYDKAIKVSPIALDAKLGKMLIYLIQEKYSAAETLGFQIIKTDYYNYYGNLRLAIALKMQNKKEQAYQIFQKMLAIYPIDVLYLSEYAKLIEIDDVKKASALYSDILILDPENISAAKFFSAKKK